MDEVVCREHLATLLGEEIGLLVQLRELLENEQSVIASRDVESLRASTASRQDRIGALARVEEQRRTLCSLHGRSPDRPGLEQLLAWCDPAGTLRPQFERCIALALECRELNDRNGLMVAARMQRVAALLESMTGRSERPSTYGPRGYAPAALTRRVIGAA